jgi:membrane protein
MLKNLIKRFPKIYAIYEHLYELSERIEKHHIYLISAGIAFNIFLYIIPLFLVAVYIIDWFFGAEVIASTLEKILRDVFPPTSSAQSLIHTIVAEIYVINTHSTFAGWIGVVVLLWLSSTLLSSLRSGLNTIFHIQTPHIFILYRFKDILLTLILALLILVSSYVIPITSAIVSILEKNSPDILKHFVSGFTVMLFSIGTSFILFYFLFRFVPNKKLSSFTGTISTGLCVITIEISRNIFAWYLGTISNYGKFYGTYAVIVSMAVWIYYFILIILFSAELGQYLNELREVNLKKKSKSI